MLRGRAFLNYLAADSQNPARRPPRPEMSERKRGNRDQHYGAKKKKTAGTGNQTEKKKPRAKKKRPRGEGVTRIPKRGKCGRVGAGKEEKAATKKRGRRGLAFSDVSRGAQRIVDTSRGRGGRVGAVLAQIALKSYPRRKLAQITHGATPAQNPRDKAISASRKFGAGFSREH